MRRALLLLAGLVVLAGLGAAAAVRIYDRPGPLPAARDVVVPRGTLARVGDALREAGVVGRPAAFRLAALLTRGAGPVRAAEFRFPARASLRDVLAVLRSARPVEHALTVPEGWTAAEIARALVAADPLAGPVSVPGEGAVLPQTYDYERGTTRAALLARMENAMGRTLDAVWRGRAPDLPLASPDALLVLASLVERETHLPAERPMVAAVFLNRLRAGMRLQSDPTAAFAAAGGLGPLARKLTRADLEAANGYNTYVVAGLPPGPICAPGLAALRAAAHPAATDALYFVADGTGGHVFAATLADQNRHVARWRALARAAP